MATDTARPAASSAAPTLTPAEFAHEWQGVTTGERASAQAQFIDICRMLGEPTPHDADPTGESYAFEKGAEKLGGGDGWADVWKRGHFAWEYKGKRKDLKAAAPQAGRFRISGHHLRLATSLVVEVAAAALALRASPRFPGLR